MMVELTFGPVGISFPAAGEYRIQLFAGPEFVIERRVVLEHLSHQAESLLARPTLDITLAFRP